MHQFVQHRNDHDAAVEHHFLTAETGTDQSDVLCRAPIKAGQDDANDDQGEKDNPGVDRDAQQ